MTKSPLQWTSEQVAGWLESVAFSHIVGVVKRHSLSGRDLLELTDAELRSEFKLNRVHERKVLLRLLERLARDVCVNVRVEFGECVCTIRVQNLQLYGFNMLREDAARAFQVPCERAVLRDRAGIVWVGGRVACIFNEQWVQSEPVFLAVLRGGGGSGKVLQEGEFGLQVQSINEHIAQVTLLLDQLCDELEAAWEVS